MDDKTWLGALAEAKAVASLLEQRCEVFTAVTGKAPFDLIAVLDGQLIRVEVKGCTTVAPSGGFLVQLRSVRPNRTGNKIRYLDASASDLVAIYLHPIDTICFVPTCLVGGRATITLHSTGHAKPSLVPRHLISDYARLPDGAVAEWTKATALKVVDPQGSVGSNPTRSAGA